MENSERENWRSTVDPRSGRTYWYHRKTRETTWFEPECLRQQAPAAVEPTVVKRVNVDVTSSNGNVIDNSMRLLRSQSGIERENGLKSLISNLNVRSIQQIRLFPNSGNLLILATSRASNNDSKLCGLKLLYSLAACPDSEGLFESNLEWSELTNIISSDQYSGIFVCGIIALVSMNPGQVFVSVSVQAQVQQWLESRLQDTHLTLTHKQLQWVTPLNQSTIVDISMLQKLSAASRKGSVISGLLFVLLATVILKTEADAVQFLRNGGISMLQRLCCGYLSPEVVKRYGRNLLLTAISSSVHVKERLLDGWIDLCTALDRGLLRVDDGIDEVEAHSSEEVYLNDCCSQYDDCEVFPGSLPNLDVLLRPRSGTAWKMSSTFLWLRCPGLRSVLTDFMATNLSNNEEIQAEGFELAVDCEQIVLVSVVRFLHCGVLVGPQALQDRLELVRIAGMLDMLYFKSVCVDWLHNGLNAENVATAMSYATEWDLPEVAKVCREFLVAKKFPPLTYEVNPRTASDDINLTLKAAIANSLNDVSALLSETTVSAAHSENRNTSSVNASARSNQNNYDVHSPRQEEKLRQPINDRTPPDNSSKSHSKQPKSGGIYRLLLAGGDEENAGVAQQPFYGDGAGNNNPERRASTGGGGQQPGSAKSGKHSNVRSSGYGQKVPGQVMPPTRPKSSFGSTTPAIPTVRGGKPASSTSSIKMTSMNSTNSYGSFSDDELDLYTNVNESVQYKHFDAVEFNPGMSLEPQREMTEPEKRLSEMSRPKKAERTAVRRSDEKQINSRDIPQEDSPPKPKRQQQQQQHPAVTVEAPQKSLPIRSVSPIVDPSISAVKSSNPLSVSTDFKSETIADQQIASARGSLHLLKNRTKSRRRSVVDADRDPENEVRTSTNENPLTISSQSWKPAVTPRVSADLSIGMAPQQAVTATQPIKSNPKPNLSSGNAPKVYQSVTSSFEEDDNVRFDDNDDYEEPNPADLLQCPDCSRKFLPGPYQKHIVICAKVFLQKRKAFDSSQKRIEAIAAVNDVIAPPKKPSKKQSAAAAAAAASKQSAASSKWKEQSDAFRNAMKSAREVSKAIATGAPLPPPVISAPDPSLIPCPHCGRRFNDKAAERHITHCKNSRSRTPLLKRAGK